MFPQRRIGITITTHVGVSNVLYYYCLYVLLRNRRCTTLAPRDECFIIEREIETNNENTNKNQKFFSSAFCIYECCLRHERYIVTSIAWVRFTCVCSSQSLVPWMRRQQRKKKIEGKTNGKWKKSFVKTIAKMMSFTWHTMHGSAVGTLPYLRRRLRIIDLSAYVARVCI